MKWLTLAILMAVSGCATLTEEQKYEREDRAIIKREKIAYILNHCSASGGMLRVNADWLSFIERRRMNNTVWFTADNVPRNLSINHVQCYKR